MSLERSFEVLGVVRPEMLIFLTSGGLNMTLNLTVIIGRGESFSLLKLGFDIELHYK